MGTKRSCAQATVFFIIFLYTRPLTHHAPKVPSQPHTSQKSDSYTENCFIINTKLNVSINTRTQISCNKTTKEYNKPTKS